jgi:hypothetical protein
MSDAAADRLFTAAPRPRLTADKITEIRERLPLLNSHFLILRAAAFCLEQPLGGQ